MPSTSLNKMLNSFHKFIYLAAFTAVILAGCSPKPYTLGPIQKFDADTTAIPEPGEAEQYDHWDRIDNTIFHQIEKPLNFNRVGRFFGKLLGIAGPDEADNVNVLDEVPESSWFTHRHYYDRMSPQELKRGPNTLDGPDTTRRWEIFSAKLEGATSGFFIEDQQGERFLIKFDSPKYPELSTSAEMIGSRFFYAAGYTVPESYITHFNADSVIIQESVKVGEDENRRNMTRDDLKTIIANRVTNDKGEIRALASKFVDGKPVGPWRMEGTRKDDPNDKVRHEERRELRGMRVLSSWLNDTDRRDANTFAVYNGSYIDHYVQDFGNTLGANGSGIHSPLHGQAYLIDPRHIVLNNLMLGMRVSTWEKVDPTPPWPSVGYFRADVFKPGSWVAAHPIPAFENMTLRDAFWGAKLVTNFTDSDIRHIVETGKLSNPEAEQYVIDVLKQRRDKIGRYWFKRVNPVDKFVFTKNSEGSIQFRFTDLGISTQLFSKENTSYRLGVFDENKNQIGNRVVTDTPMITLTGLDNKLGKDISTMVDGDTQNPSVFKVRIITHRPELEKKQPVDVYFSYAKNPLEIRIIGIDRKYE